MKIYRVLCVSTDARTYDDAMRGVTIQDPMRWISNQVINGKDKNQSFYRPVAAAFIHSPEDGLITVQVNEHRSDGFQLIAKLATGEVRIFEYIIPLTILGRNNEKE
jgi:hypothetical protein